jgi:hypothetical protein
MAQRAQSLDELVRSLPVELQQEVYNFAKYLADTKTSKARHKFKFDWEGDLGDLREQFSSVDLQHDILNEWDTNVSH